MQLEDIKIMCVDDSQTVRTFLKTLLEKSYSHLYFATNGQEGIELYDKVQPNIIISDINMPIMKGLEMVRKLQAKKDANTYFLMLSTESGERFINQAAKQGVSAYIGKNQAGSKLKPAIDKLVKLLLESKKENKVDLKFAQFQPLLELNEDMTILSDGLNIYSSNEVFLKFLGVESLEAFMANYGSVEYLVDEVEGIDHSNPDINWIDILLTKKDGVYLYIETLQEEKIRLLAKAILLDQRRKIYAITFIKEQEQNTQVIEVEKKEVQKTVEISSYLFEDIIFSTDGFKGYLHFILPILKEKNSGFGFSVFKLEKIKLYLESPDNLKKVILLINSKLDNLETLYLYNENIVIFHHSITLETIKKRAGGVNSLLKSKGLSSKIGVLTSKTELSYEKVIEYLDKF